jgi:hypothetical protein
MEASPCNVRFTPESGHGPLRVACREIKPIAWIGLPQSWKAVITVIGAVYGGVTLGGRHGSIPYRARIGSRGWHCFFPVRDRTT